MSKITKKVNETVQKIKLKQNKLVTNLGLHVFSHGKKLNDVAVYKNIDYGKFKLQRFDFLAPKNTKSTTLPVIFYIHGGAWCGGDKFGYTKYCKRLAENDYLVVNINYRLMPKVSVRTCVADVIKAIDYFTENTSQILNDAGLSCNADLNNVYLIGDSAGAHIASLIAAKATCGELKLKCNISALGLYYGVYAFENISHDPSPIMTGLDKYWKSIYVNTQPIYKSISTVNYITDKFPPTFMTSGEIDKLHFQSEILCRMLKYNGVKVKYLSFDKSRQDARHAFLNAPLLSSAKEAFACLTKFFKQNKSGVNSNDSK